MRYLLILFAIGLSAFSIASEDIGPKLIVKIKPEYPLEAFRNGIEGSVIVVFDITQIGATENVKVFESTPSVVFDANSVEAVKKWKFKPVVLKGEPVVFKNYTFKIDFSLQNGVVIEVPYRRFY